MLRDRLASSEATRTAGHHSATLAPRRTRRSSARANERSPAVSLSPPLRAMSIEREDLRAQSKERGRSGGERGRRYVGFVFFPAVATLRRSRNSRIARVAGADRRAARRSGRRCRNGYSCAVLVTSVPLDMLQLHGAESPLRVAESSRALRAAGHQGDRRRRGGGSSTRSRTMTEVADRLAVRCRAVRRMRPGRGATRAASTGGCWAVAACRLPWLLAGGLDAGNLAEAVRCSGAAAVDVSSGVEDAPGRKSIEKIRAFLAAAARRRARKTARRDSSVHGQRRVARFAVRAAHGGRYTRAENSG